jgi:hypothetical protein
MGSNFYNKDEEKFKKIIGLLKELPRENAPDNFEYNLMLKIKNGNFEVEDGRRIKLSWVLTPVSAFAVTAVLLFFFFNPQNTEFENPLMTEPQLRAEAATGGVDTANIKEYFVHESPSYSIGENSAGEVAGDNMEVNQPAYRVVLQPNDVVVKERINYPFNQSNNLNLDNFIENGNTRTTVPSRSMLVGGAPPQQNFDFDGFRLREEVDQKILEMYRARLDSIKKLMEENRNR